MVTIRAPLILDFDLENRPLSYLGDDFTTPDVTAIAWTFGGSARNIEVRCLGETKPEHLLTDFLVAYDLADVVTGHNIIRHDLRHLNAMLLERGEPPLHPKLVCDTYAHLKRRAAGFASQATLAEILGIKMTKVGMSTPAWRAANRLSRKGVERIKVRVVRDVAQHVLVRRKLVERGWLRSPTMWSP